MPINFKAPLASALVNATFLDKTVDDFTIGQFSLRNGDISTHVENVQAFLNTLRADIDSNDIELADHETRISTNETALTNLSNVTNDAQLKRESGDFDTFTEKVTPVDVDIVLIEDSEDAYSKKKVLLSNMLGGGGGGGSFVWELNGNISPIESILNGASLLDFDYQDSAEIWAFIQVPDSYSGDQIKLKGLSFTSADSANNVLFKCQTYLNRSGQALNYENHISTNTEITLTTADVLNVVSEIDLTDANGAINLVPVLPNDYLAIKLYRDITNETASSQELARFFKFSASISFKA